MILPVTASSEGSIVTSAGPDYVTIKLFIDRNCSVKVRTFTVAEARAFMEYLGCHMGFKIGELYIDLLSEAVRDQLMIDLEHAIRRLEAFA